MLAVSVPGLVDKGEHPMSMYDDGPRPSWIPGHARRHQRTGELDTRWMPACQCGWAFYASVRTLRIADRTHGFHLNRVHASRHSAAS
jgi:hypothetical protein